MDPNAVTYFGETDARGKRIKFGIKAKDRLKHVYVIGKTGMGKSTLLENMAIQDIQNGNGMAFIDPHGGTAEKLLDYVPEHRIKDVVYFAPFDIEHPIAFNVMQDIGPEKRHLVVSGLMSAFMKLFGEESFSDRMQYILQNTILALLEYPGSTMLGINKMLADKEYRNRVIANITDPSVRTYWTKEYAGYTERFAAEAIPSIQNKIGQFTSNPLIRNIIGQEKSSFDFRDIMDKGKIMIINLSKGRVGEGNANLLGSMLITKIYLAAMSRADRSAQELVHLPNFYLYVDEFQSFANKSFADILSEARKYKLNLTIAHQYIEQMEEEVRDAVFGNVGTMITFRVGAFDSEVLEKEFAPVFMAVDLVNLGYIQIYLKLMIDGIASQPFSAKTLPPIAAPDINFKDAVIESSRKQFAKPKDVVEKGISDWHDSTAPKDVGREQNREPRGEFRPQSAPERVQNNNSGGSRQPERNFDRPVDRPKEEFRQPPPRERVIPQVDENKQAFMKAKEVLEQKKVPAPPLESPSRPAPVSLSSLRPEDSKKIPSKENISSLKQALVSVITKPVDLSEKNAVVTKSQVQVKPSAPIAPKVEQKVHIPNPAPLKKPEENSAHVPPPPTKEKSLGEVPESVLRDLLDVKEKK